MNTRNLSNHYGHLTAEERFCLITAASGRGDEVERDRVAYAGALSHLSFPDHMPYALAFKDVLFLTYIELLEDAASYQECNARTDKLLHDSIDVTRRRRNANWAPPPKKEQRKDDLEFPDWHRVGRAAYGLGFLFKVKMQGWKLFCSRLNVEAFELWEQMDLPGLDRLKRALTLAISGAAFPSVAEMARWMNEIRPAGDPELTEAEILTAHQFAASLNATFQERVRWWGG